MQDKPQPKKPGRNEPCPCGSGKKHKRCCLQPSISPTYDERVQERIELLNQANTETPTSPIRRRPERQMPMGVSLMIAAALMGGGGWTPPRR